MELYILFTKPTHISHTHIHTDTHTVRKLWLKTHLYSPLFHAHTPWFQVDSPSREEPLSKCSAVTGVRFCLLHSTLRATLIPVAKIDEHRRSILTSRRWDAHLPNSAFMLHAPGLMLWPVEMKVWCCGWFAVTTIYYYHHHHHHFPPTVVRMVWICSLFTQQQGESVEKCTSLNVAGSHFRFSGEVRCK